MRIVKVDMSRLLVVFCAFTLMAFVNIALLENSFYPSSYDADFSLELPSRDLTSNADKRSDVFPTQQSDDTNVAREDALPTQQGDDKHVTREDALPTQQSEDKNVTREDALPPKQSEDKNVTREDVMRVVKKMYGGSLINRDYFVHLLRNAKSMVQALDTVYDVPLEKASGTQVTVRNDKVLFGIQVL